MAQDGIILTEAQAAQSKKLKKKNRRSARIETEHPGYPGSQDTFYVGNKKDVGQIYQQTFIDTYLRVAVVKLYDRKNALTAAGLLNDRVILCSRRRCSFLRFLTDRGSEYYGNRGHPRLSALSLD